MVWFWIIMIFITILVIGLISWGVKKVKRTKVDKNDPILFNAKHCYFCAKREQPNVTREEFYKIMHEFNKVYKIESDINSFEDIVKNGKTFLLKTVNGDGISNMADFLNSHNVLWESFPIFKFDILHSENDKKYYFFSDVSYVNNTLADINHSECIVIRQQQTNLSKAELENILIDFTKSNNLPIYEIGDFEYCINGGSEFVIFTHSSTELLDKLLKDLNMKNVNAIIKKLSEVNTYLKPEEINVSYGKGNLNG